MTDDERKAAHAAWIASRPESIRRLAAEFPLGASFAIGDRVLYLVGYNEDDSLLVSRYNPATDYESATTHPERLCASHVRDGRHGFDTLVAFTRAVKNAAPAPQPGELSAGLTEDELRALERFADELEKPTC